jgi:hypothetical protein
MFLTPVVEEFRQMPSTPVQYYVQQPVEYLQTAAPQMFQFMLWLLKPRRAGVGNAKFPYIWPFIWPHRSLESGGQSFA